MDCIWKVRPEDRRCEYCSYHGGCPERNRVYFRTAEAVADAYEDILYKLTGYLATAHTRKREVVWLRYMIAYQMRLDGFSTLTIGEVMDLDHATIIHATKNMRDMLHYPGMYAEEYEVWNEFQKILYSQKG